YKLMNVTSNLGLNMRAQPDTSSPVVAVLLQDHHVFVERTENNWAYVNCGELKGWCSLDYLQPVPFQGTKTYRESEIEAARAAAELIIDSYYDRTTGGRTDITAANAYAYFESCCDVYSYATSFGSQFEKLIPVAADEHYAYYFVEDSKIKTVEDLCNKYFSCFSDELAASCLRGKVLLLDGRLAVAFRSDCYYGYYVSHSYTVNQVAPDRIEVNVVVQEYDSSLKRDSSGKATPDSPIYETYYTFPCVIEDGVWVFESMDVVFDR
ncbi:MAG: SH3 domain-containing protein, partial [Clostridia bacterium]|nr:SH3 domain-containing protein [Clostridia bacterium]